MLFSNPEITELINKHFVATWKMVRPATKMVLKNTKDIIGTVGGGNSATYFCDPRGRVLHILPGVYTPETFKQELNWVISVYQKARGKNMKISLDDPEYSRTIAKAHTKKRREDMLKDRVHVVKMVTGYDNNRKPEWQAKDLQALTTNKVLKEKLHRIDAMPEQSAVIVSMYSIQLVFQERVLSIQKELELVHMILAARSLPTVEDIKADVFEVILSEPLSGYKPVEKVYVEWNKKSMVFKGEQLFERSSLKK